MDQHAPTIVAAALGAALALIAFAARLSRRFGDRAVDGLYYASYACTALAALLFVLRGLRAASLVVVIACSAAWAGGGSGKPGAEGYVFPDPRASTTSVKVVVVATSGDPRGDALHAAARALVDDVQLHDPRGGAAGLPASVAAMARHAGGGAVAFACTATRCSLPAGDPRALERAVEALR